ncbi:MAG: hypothetical protein HY864_08785 [Chloroflexi bacterium]|nr:hypothetical protein [Chloroflexota bacterium]
MTKGSNDALHTPRFKISSINAARRNFIGIIHDTFTDEKIFSGISILSGFPSPKTDQADPQAGRTSQTSTPRFILA